MNVAILHNRRPATPDPLLPDDAFEEFDRTTTVTAIADALAGLGVTPVPVVADRTAPRRLEDGAFDFVFNIAEGEGGRCREAIAPALCELLGLPYTGPDPLTLAVTLDKATARRIVAPDVPVASAHLMDDEGDASELRDLHYPVLVKPNHEGSSKGIQASALCATPAAAHARSRWVRARYGQPALVEEFLDGPEITVGIHGNGRGARVLGMMEVAPIDDSPQAFIYSLDVKRHWRLKVQYHNPPRVSGKVLQAVTAHALAAYRLLGCRDLARLDFRLDGNERPFFLECNALPGLDPDNSDVVMLAEPAITYPDLVQSVLLNAGRRLGIPVP